MFELLILCVVIIKGVRGTVVAVGFLDRSKEQSFKAAVKMDGIQSLNNFEFTMAGQVKVHRQYNVGNGKVYCI